ncbi:hypothetical protein KRIGEM_01931 [Komagataeibacter rhaeticus]|nr:hypothetical protein KRIGEM_01931 [Komagataeibacter rhaeticus]
MATAIPKITLSSSRDIPFNRLVLSQSNGNRPLWAALIMRPVCAVYSRVSSSMATVRGAG